MQRAVICRGLTVLSLEHILRTNAKQQNETVSNCAECGGVRMNKQLPVRDTFVLLPFNCLVFFFFCPLPILKALGDDSRNREKWLLRCGKWGRLNTQKIKMEESCGYQVHSLSQGLCTHCCFHSSFLTPESCSLHLLCYFVSVQVHIYVQVLECVYRYVQVEARGR